MDSFEMNKILGAILGTALIVVALNIASGAIFAPEMPAKPGYSIVVPKAATGTQQAPADKEKEAKSSDHREKDHFFNEWALERARKEKVDGIYVLKASLDKRRGFTVRPAFDDPFPVYNALILVNIFVFAPYFEGTIVGDYVHGQELWGYVQGASGAFFFGRTPR